MDLIVVRIIIGYKKFNCDTVGLDEIFKQEETNTSIALNDMVEYRSKMWAMLKLKSFVNLCQFHVLLQDSDTSEVGMDSHRIKMWIPMKKSLRFEADQVGDIEQTFDPIVYAYCFNKCCVDFIPVITIESNCLVVKCI